MGQVELCFKFQPEKLTPEHSRAYATHDAALLAGAGLAVPQIAQVLNKKQSAVNCLLTAAYRQTGAHSIGQITAGYWRDGEIGAKTHGVATDYPHIQELRAIDPSQLDDRELQMIRGLAAGQRFEELAAAQEYSVRTAYNIRQNVYGKLLAEKPTVPRTIQSLVILAHVTHIA